MYTHTPGKVGGQECSSEQNNCTSLVVVVVVVVFSSVLKITLKSTHRNLVVSNSVIDAVECRNSEGKMTSYNQAKALPSHSHQPTSTITPAQEPAMKKHHLVLHQGSCCVKQCVNVTHCKPSVTSSKLVLHQVS